MSILETLMSAVLLAVILGTTAAGVATDTRIEQVMTAGLGPQMTAQDALQRIRAELRTASIGGEDKNGNGQLDEDEDTNGNGVLDAAWNLADATESQTSLTFNQRHDARADGAVTAIGVVSTPTTYRIVDERLVRTTGGQDIVLATSVSNLRFSRSGALVTVSLDVRQGETIRTLTTRVWIRN